jgi:hypothetical protein
MVRVFAPVFVRLSGAIIRGTSGVPYAESRNTAPATPSPFTRDETIVTAGFRFVVLDGAS